MYRGRSPPPGSFDGGPDPKRGRMSGGLMGAGPGGGGSMNYGSGGRVVGPSKVVQVRSLPEQVMEADLIDACVQFGPISYVSLTGRGTAYVEFETAQSAEQCIAYNSTTDVFVMGSPAFFAPAQIEQIQRRGFEVDRPGNVLVLTVQNPKYPITTDVIQAICKPIAAPSRIIVIKRQGVIALCEFPDVETARNLKHRLNGCDIYSGCCTLKIEYAKLSRLNVTKNDADQWDYVGPPGGAKDRPALLSEPAYPVGMNQRGPMGGDELGYDEFGRPIYEDGANGGDMGRGMRGGGGYPGPAMDPYGPQGGGGGMPRGGGGYYGESHGGMPASDSYSRGYGGGGQSGYGGDEGGPGPMMDRGGYQDSGRGAPDGTGMSMEGAVIMVYGLSEDFNCDRLFNIVCLYGNVVRIKFLKSKTDAAMVQMGDPVAADRCIRFLNKTTVFEKQLQVTMSKKPYLEDMRTEPFLLPNNTPSYKDFTGSRSNRYVTPDMAAKNRINPPDPHLYFFNAPPDLTEEQIRDVFKKLELKDPTSVKVFEARGGRSTAGIIEYEDAAAATEAVVLANHEPIKSDASRTPYLIKFTFAGPPGGRDGGGPPRGGRGGGRGGRGGYGGRGREEREDRYNGPGHLVESRFPRGRGGRGRGRGRGRD